SPARAGGYQLLILAPITAVLAVCGESWGVCPVVYHSLEPFLEAFLGMLLVERAAAGRLSRLLEVGPLVYVGTVSYGVYVWHGLVCSLLHLERGPDRFLAVATFSILL